METSKDGTTVYWSCWLDSNPAVSGTRDSSSSTTITSSQQANVGGIDGGTGPCTMERDDTLTVTLGMTQNDSGSPTTASGSLTYGFSAVSGSDCTDQLSASEGVYATLPCSIAYSLSATKQ